MQADKKNDQPGPDHDDLRWAVEAELAWHEGDAKAAIATLLEDNRHLRVQLALMEAAGSKGFTRGWRPTYRRMPQEG
ncbi:hypothetical protein [Neorhizobium petrolearium]|uniref:hypothetical protein n=1 Tax=Neorhizobium petrolearium TaxID=515361 RepID=UPI003F16CAE7